MKSISIDSFIASSQEIHQPVVIIVWLNPLVPLLKRETSRKGPRENKLLLIEDQTVNEICTFAQIKVICQGMGVKYKST